ncbi:ABC transporter substrate-binding protein [Shinella granuli]|uniref:Iron(III) transport system substrate-binding protein n=1 Tax=Shinella granuli TaxID=323621 RepID=A0A4R2C1U7_SHIGR|nr:ABC transporter substrate-binding protein [Shinella granuli]TCN33523.1 iron(III) transport system substrate-binding protein [Shinella granuli]
MWKKTLALSLTSWMLASVAAQAEPGGTITLYTSQPNAQVTAALDGFAKVHPKVKVEIFRSGTTEIMTKLQAETTAGNAKADVVLLADEVSMSQLKKAGMLLPYAEAKVDGLPKALIDADKTFFGTRLITTGLIYNTNLVKTPPSSWAEMSKPEIAAKTILPSPLYSGAAAMNVGTLVQQPEFGWKYYEALADNKAVAANGNGAVMEAVARGEKAYGIIIDYMAFSAKAKGSPVDFVFPKEGVTVMSQPVAILKSSQNQEAAKAFVDWQLSEPAQKMAVSQGYYPAVSSIEQPKGYPPLGSVKLMQVDLNILLEKDEANKRQFSEHFGG